MIIKVNRVVVLILAGVVSSSCSSEKLSLSPVYNSSGNTPQTKIILAGSQNKSSELFYASELTNQMASFPTFSNTGINTEVTKLKYQVKEYVYAVQEYNLSARTKALTNIEKSYRKIQKLRPYLQSDENETINRYLVRIKSNISKLEAANIEKNTATNP